MTATTDRIKNQAKTLDQYRQKILDLQANVNYRDAKIAARDAKLAAQSATIAELREALAQVKALVNPNRPGGVSRYELEQAADLIVRLV